MAPTRRIPEAEWQRHKPTIRHLYLAQNMTLDELMSTMADFRGFSATKYQYTTQLSRWKFKKYCKSETWKGIIVDLKTRQLEASEVFVHVNNDEVSLKRLKKALQRYAPRDGQLATECHALNTLEGVSIQPKFEKARQIQCSIRWRIVIDLPWHRFVDSLGTPFSSIVMDRSPLPIASADQNFLLDLLPRIPTSPNFEFFRSLYSPSPSPFEQFDPPSYPGAFQDDAIPEELEVVTVTPFPKDITACFGITSTLADKDRPQILQRSLRPFVIERQPKEVRNAVNALMDPNSAASMQILTSYMALFLSNGLAKDYEIKAVLIRVEELNQLGNLTPLFSQTSPSARAVATCVLHAAIQIDANKFLKQALKSGATRESPTTGYMSRTLLQCALKSGNVEAARVLIDEGADVNVGSLARRDEENCKHRSYHVQGFTCECEIRGHNSPIALAASSQACVDLIPDLLDKRAVIPEKNPVLLNAILHKASLKTVTCLIEAGADINQCAIAGLPIQDRHNWIYEGVTPLSAAAQRRNLQMVRVLLSARADPNGPVKSENHIVFNEYGALHDRFQSPLLSAVRGRGVDGDVDNDASDLYEIMRLLLEAGANPNISSLDMILENSSCIGDGKIADLYNLREKKKDMEVYPLQAAARFGKVEIVQLLLQHGASINTDYGTPALALAVLQSNSEMVRFLLSQGADPNRVGKQYYCRSPLQAAVAVGSLELIDLLLGSEADINKCSDSYGGRTPLQQAAEMGNEHIIEHLLTRRASMHSPPAHTGGCSVLQGFVENRLHSYVSKALQDGVNPNRGSLDSGSPLVAAVVNNDTMSLQALLKNAVVDIHEYASAKLPYYGDEDPAREDVKLFRKAVSPIQWAAALNHVEVARHLLNARANVNQPPCEGNGKMALHLAIWHEHHVMVSFLIGHRAEVGAISTDGSALIKAIGTGNDAIIGLLLENGADPNQSHFDEYEYSGGISPLEYACKKLKASAVRRLLHAGVDVNRGASLRRLFFFGCSRGSVQQRREILELLLESGADVNKRDYDDDTALQAAIGLREFDCAYRLIEKGADINAPASKGERGRTALQQAVSVGNVDMVEHLLEKGADVNAPAAVDHGATALQAAAIRGYLRIAQILLERGADIDAEAAPKGGMTAIEGAAEWGRIDMVKLLLDNYRGPKPIREMCELAYKAAKERNEWFVMELVESYQPPNEVPFEADSGVWDYIDQDLSVDFQPGWNHAEPRQISVL